MDDVRACPICGGDDLEPIRESRYSSDQPAPTGDPGLDWGYRVQRDFVFAHWAPGADHVVITELLCVGCGFVLYSPRPTQADIDRKYRVLTEMGVALGHREPFSRVDAHRARALRRRLGRHVQLRGADVLDVGGGDGRRMREVLRAGARCCVVDYAKHQLPGIERLGDTIEDLRAGERFDVAILSHVAEHVADPVDLLRTTAAVAGLLYVEVPVEIWRGSPAGRDPVTHVNYFTESSLRSAVQAAGLRVARSQTTFSFYSHTPLEVSWCIAARGQRDHAVTHDATETRRRLTPGPALRVRRRASAAIASAHGRLLER